MMNNISPRDLITLHDVKLIFRNFSGEARRFNNAGDRNVTIVLTPAQSMMLRERGYNVKTLAPYREGDEPQDILKVNVSYRYQKPTVVTITSRSRVELDEDTVGILDYAFITKADISFRGSAWTMSNGDSGVSAYLNSLYVTLEEDELAAEYAQMPMPSDDEDPF